VKKAKLGRYDEAIPEFMRAYELSPSPTPLYNVAVGQAAMGLNIEAIAMFQRYLAEAGDKVPADRRAKVLKRIADLEAKLGRITIRVSPETAKVMLDGKPVDLAAAAKGIRVEAREHAVRATAEGYYDRDEQPRVAEGAVVDVKLELQRVPPPQPPVITPAASAATGAPPPAPDAPAPSDGLMPIAAPPPPPPPGAAVAQPASQAPTPPDRTSGGVGRRIGYSLAAVGAAALAAGGVFYLIARSDLDKAVQAGCNSSSCMGDGLAHWHDAQNGVTRSRIAAIAGGALLAGGLTLVVIAPPSRDAPAGVAIAGQF
jgi:hypothetical protein